MTTELPKQYDPREAQQRWSKFWDERQFFHARPDSTKEPFAIVIPPPNVTGALHMGHALNNTLQDVLIRWRRMQGYNAMWMPGTDHAGIATQAVVERLVMQTEKKTRHDLGRDELVKRIWQWKDKYEARILGQLRSMGCSCDWERTRFTLDETCARAVRQTFFNLFRDGLIYRGKRLVNWDTQLQTSVADDETYTEDIKGSFWTFKYPVKGEPGASATGGEAPEFIRFSTTRPETMLGDTAVCVHPSDERYKHLIGKKVTIPLVGREIPIIADALLADPKLGTGCVKVTPAHDPNDYACWSRNPHIGMINILNTDGTINENGGKYKGLDRYKAREAVIAEMEAMGYFEEVGDREIPMKYSDRSKTPIEPILSDQWFVKMADMAQQTMAAVEDGRVKFTPERYKNSYLDWLAEKRDWCISRQLWWGHRIPVWSIGCRDKATLDATAQKVLSTASIAKGLKEGNLASSIQEDVALNQMYEKILERGTDEAKAEYDRLSNERPPYRLHLCVREEGSPYVKELEAIGLLQSEDVLDTWFSSALWPHSTLGWPEQTPELKYWYPTSVLCTSRDIITLWVARMVLTGLYNLGEIPFHNVYIHPKLLDGFGETMSKSKGNGIDPLDIIDRYGVDAMRFVMAHLATETQDNRMPVANVCPHCDTLIPVKQEHMYMRTKKLACPSCKKPFRPGGPWPTDDPELPTAKQASDRFDMGRNFANKIWNAARFILMNLEGYEPKALGTESLPIEDRWILSRLATTTATITRELEAFRFAEAARLLYEFVWTEFCDWYVEMAKGRLKTDGKPIVQRMLVGLLDAIVRLAQPMMPFLSESIWQALNEVAFERGLPSPEPSAESVTIAAWPSFPAEWQDASMETRFARMQELVRAIREVRNRYNVEPKTNLDVFVRAPKTTADDFVTLSPFIRQLAGVGEFETGPSVAKPQQSASHVSPDFEAYVSLKGLIDVAVEIKRLEKQLAEKRKHLQTTHAKLDNPAFAEKAPKELVAQQREALVDTQKQIASIEATIRELSTAS
jgi:valyl-tRNA synthetase